MKTANCTNAFGKKKHQIKARQSPHRTIFSNICLFLVSILSIELTHADWLMECGVCHCKWNSGKKTADCKNSSLFLVPSNLSPEVQVLDLSHNHIEHLLPNVFLKSELQNLHKLYIRNSSLQKVDSRSFADLNILIELDLSNNLIRSLQVNQFHHLVKVRAILLNNNLIEALPDGIFQDLSYLHRIELRGNRLTHVGMQVFVNLPMLSQIYLDENRLNFMRKESFENLKRLTALSLDNNPWNCTCDLQVFRDFVLQRNLYTPPTACYYPAHLRGTLWIDDHLEAFVCKPKILYPARGTSINLSKENVTLTCRVNASPNTQVTWTHNKQTLRVNPSYSSNRFQVHLQYDEHSKHKNFGRNMLISRLTIYSVDKSDEGTYTCLAENAGGRDSVQMNLVVGSTQTKDLWVSQENFIVIISILALGLLSIIFFLLMAACCLYKHFKLYKDLAYRQRHLDHFAHLDTELNNTGGVIVESSIIESGMIVCSTNPCEENDGKVTTTTSGFQNVHKENALKTTDKNVRIYSGSLLEDGSYLITNTRKEKPISMQPKSHDAVSNNTTILQKPKWPAKYSSRISKDTIETQPERCAADFQPDLVAAYRKDVNS